MRPNLMSEIGHINVRLWRPSRATAASGAARASCGFGRTARNSAASVYATPAGGTAGDAPDLADERGDHDRPADLPPLRPPLRADHRRVGPGPAVLVLPGRLDSIAAAGVRPGAARPDSRPARR